MLKKNRTKELRDIINKIRDENVSSELVTDFKFIPTTENNESNKNTKNTKRNIKENIKENPAGKKSENQFLIKINLIQPKLAQIKQKLLDFKKLSEESSLFKEDDAKISSISLAIKREIGAVMGELEVASKLLENSKGGANQQGLHSKNILVKTKKDLSDITCTFQDVLFRRTEKLRHYNKRKQLYSTKSMIIPRDFSNIARKHTAEHPDQQLKDEIFEDESPSSERNPHYSSVLYKGASMQQLRTDHVNAGRDRYLRNRLEATQNIEQTISELSTMYHRLASIVAVQEEVCERIDTNVDITTGNVDDARIQLEKFHLHVTGNRVLILKVFTMLIFISAMFFFFYR